MAPTHSSQSSPVRTGVFTDSVESVTPSEFQRRELISQLHASRGTGLNLLDATPSLWTVRERGEGSLLGRVPAGFVGPFGPGSVR